MKWKNSSLYRTKINFNPENFSLRNLIYNYQPIIGADAVTLYLFFYSESTNGITSSLFLSHERIIKITNLIKEEISLALSKLELFSLIDLYYDSDDNRVIYVLKNPAGIDDMEEDFISEYLVKKIGPENAKINESFLSNKNIEKSLNNYSKKTSNSSILTNKSFRITKEKIQLSIDIDLNPLFRLMFNKNMLYTKWWNRKIEAQVKEAIVIYDLTFLDVYLLFESLLTKGQKVSSSNLFNYLKQTKANDDLWVDKFLKDKIINTKKFELLKTISPEQFINLRLKRPIKIGEDRIINQLKSEFNFSDEIINIILDFSIVKNNGNIVGRYILKISETIQRRKISSLREVVDFLRTIYLDVDESKSNKANQFYQFDDDTHDMDSSSQEKYVETENGETIEMISRLYGDDETDESEIKYLDDESTEEMDLNNLENIVKKYME